jgi:hypothetical protein
MTPQKTFISKLLIASGFFFFKLFAFFCGQPEQLQKKAEGTLSFSL